MWLIVLEALAAVSILVFVMWWTMFSGRRGGELAELDAAADERPPDPARPEAQPLSPPP